VRGVLYGSGVYVMGAAAVVSTGVAVFHLSGGKALFVTSI
jgi:hypothetical protein